MKSIHTLDTFSDYPLQSIHSANVWASAVESGAACVNNLWNQFIKGGLKIKVNDCNSKGQTDLSLGSATPPLLPLLVLIRGSRSTHHRGTCPSLSTATSLPTAAAGPSSKVASFFHYWYLMHIHIYIISCFICITLLVCMFTGLTTGYWITKGSAPAWEDHRHYQETQSHSQLPDSPTLNSLSTPPEMFPEP